MEKIILYTTNCPKCMLIKSELKKKDIDFTENNDISEMKRLGFFEVPKLKVEDKYLAFGEALAWINNRV